MVEIFSKICNPRLKSEANRTKIGETVLTV